MIAKPTPALWRETVRSFGNSGSRSSWISSWITRTWRWRPSLLASWRGSTQSLGPVVDIDRIDGEHVARASTTDRARAGGMLMIFRKESRNDSFQRQVTSLRKQAQSDDEAGTDEFRFDEPQDTSQFATAKPTAREEEFTSSRVSVDDLAPTQAIPQAQPAYRPTWQTADAGTSVIAATSNWNGVLRTEGSINVHGRAEGELHAAADVFVAEGAEVDAHIYAENVVVAGMVRGKIEARGRLELLSQGHVSGDVKSPRLVVHEGAQLSGQLKMDSGTSAQMYSTDAGAAKGRRPSR